MLIKPCFIIASVTSGICFPGYGVVKFAMLLQLCAHILPSKCAGMGPSFETIFSPYFFRSSRRTYACNCK